MNAVATIDGKRRPLRGHLRDTIGRNPGVLPRPCSTTSRRPVRPDVSQGAGSGRAFHVAAKQQFADVFPAATLDGFQSVAAITLESLEKTAFSFASGRPLAYRWRRITKGLFHFHDCLLLQRAQRRRCPQCRQCRSISSAQRQADLWLPWLQRRMRPMRAHHQDHPDRSPRRLRRGLPCRMSARRERRASARRWRACVGSSGLKPATGRVRWSGQSGRVARLGNVT
jgi:hypothetical protein